MTRRLQAFLGLSTDVGGQLLVTLATFGVTPLMLSMTSKSEFGAWQTVLSVLTYLGLLDLGLGIALVRTIAALPDESDDERFCRVSSSAYFSFCALAVIFFIAGWWFSNHAPVWFGVSPEHQIGVVKAYRWASLGAALALPAGTYGAILAGKQRMALANIARIVGTLIGLGMCVVLLYKGFGIVGLAISSMAGVLAGAAISWWFVRRTWPTLRIRLAYVDRASLKDIWKFGGLFQVARVANTVAVSADSLVIASRLNAAMVTPYNLTSKLPILCSITLASKLPLALFPGLSSMFSQGSKERLRAILGVVLGLSTRLACVSAFLIALCNQRFVTLWVGHDAFGGRMLNSVFVYWAAQDTLLRGLGSFVYASGILRGWAAVCVIEAAVNLSASFFLAGPLKLVGVALGTSIARTITFVWLCWWLRRQLGISTRKLISSVAIPLLRCVPGCALGWLVSQVMPDSLGWTWILAIVVTTLAGNLACFEGWVFIRSPQMPVGRRIVLAGTSSIRC